MRVIALAGQKITIALAGVRRSVLALTGTVTNFAPAFSTVETGQPIGLLLALTYTVEA